MTNKHLYHGHPKLEGGGGREGGRRRGEGRRGEGGREGGGGRGEERRGEGGEGGKGGGGRGRGEGRRGEGGEGGREEGGGGRGKKKIREQKKEESLFLIFPFLYCVIFFRYLSETEDGNFINVGRASCTIRRILSRG